MKNILFVTLMIAANFAFAHNCPNEMKAIDAKMSMSRLPAVDVAKVKSLREEGEKHHNAGKHDESMKVLGEAKKILGV